MSQIGTIHHFPVAQADRAAAPEAQRSVQLLDIPASPPELAAISGRQSLRLGVELALRGRWAFMLALLCVSLLALPGLLGARAWAQQSAHAMVGLLVFTYGLARGVDGASRQHAFWAGLGAAPGSLELGVVLVDLLFMGLVTGLGWLVGPDDPVFLFLGAAAGLVTYGLGSATRAAARSEAGRFGLIIAMLLVAAVNTAVAFVASYGHVVEGIGLQLGILAALGLGARVLGAARAPQSAAGRGRRRWGWLGVALAGLLVVPIQFLQGMPEVTGQPSREGALLLPDPDPLEGQQLWRLDAAGEPERLAVRGRIHGGVVGPRGSAMVVRTAPLAMAHLALVHETAADAERALRLYDGAREGLVLADGGYVECAGVLGSGRTVFDDDGMGATRTAFDRGETWRLDAEGCRRLPSGHDP